MIPDSHAQARSRLIDTAIWCVAIALLVAPFRSSAGLRGGLLLIALIAVLCFAWQQRHAALSAVVPLGSWLSASIIARTAVALAACFWSGRVFDSLGEWRGEFFTQAGTFWIAWMIGRHRESLLPILIALFIGLLVLCGAIIHNPYQQTADFLNTAGKPPPFYGGAGQSSVWVTYLAALIPLVAVRGGEWLGVNDVSQRAGGWWLGAVVVCVVAIIVCAILAGARWVWPTLVLMLIVGGVLAMRGPALDLRIGWPHLIVASLALLALMIVSGYVRFKTTDAPIAPTLSVLAQDNRWLIWAASWRVIEVSPVLGIGLGRDTVLPLLTSQFNEPIQKVLFIQGHNMFLNAQLQMGLAGTLALLAMVVALFARFGALLKHSAPVRLIGICGLMLVIAMVMRSSLDDFLYRQCGILFFGLCGLLLGRAERLQAMAVPSVPSASSAASATQDR